MDVPTVEIVLDKPRHLRLDFAAFMAYEKETGRSVFSFQDTGNTDATSLVTLLWAALKHEDDKLTIEDVAKMVHIGNVQEISQKLNEAFSKVLPQEESQEESDDAQKKAEQSRDG